MNEVIKRLSEKCKYSMKLSSFKDLYLEVLQMVLDSNCDDNTKLFILTELYKFSFYHHVSVSLDSRGDFRFKYDVLSRLKRCLLENNITQDIKNELSNANNDMKDRIENPVKYAQDAIEFYKELLDDGAIAEEEYEKRKNNY